MNTRNQIIAAWCGPAFMVLMGIGWMMIAGFFPPHSPAFSGEEVSAFYQPVLSIRSGLLITLLSTVLFIPFSAAISIQLAKIEGGFPVWSAAQLAAGAGTTLTLAFPVVFWAAAAFRPERSPELMLLLDDLGWIPFASMVVPFLLQPFCIALIGFSDKSEHPVFPRWACYFNIWTALLILPGGFIIFFKSGPFAWNGLFGIYLPFLIFSFWFGITTYLLIKAIKRQAQAGPHSR